MRLGAGFLQLIDVKLSRLLQLPPKSLPLLIIWITDQCNLNCRMCDQWQQKPSLVSKELSTEELYSVIESARRLHTQHITISGGEPFLRTDIINVIRAIRQSGIGCHICSNGTMLTGFIDDLKAVHPNSISVSLDGHTPEIHNDLRGTDCFNRAIEGIRMVRKHCPKIKLGINHMICNRNFRHLNEMIPLAKKLKVDRLNVFPIHTNLQHRRRSKSSFKGLLIPKENLAELRKILDRYIVSIEKTDLRAPSRVYHSGIIDFFSGRSNYFKCYAGYLTCAIDTFGGVAPCDDMDPVANVRDKKLEHIWKSRSFDKFRRHVHQCPSSCWDSTHTNLNILMSLRGQVMSGKHIIDNMNYYLR